MDCIQRGHNRPLCLLWSHRDINAADNISLWFQIHLQEV